MDKETKINRLLKEYKRKLLENTINQSVILVDFAREYNKTWSEEDGDSQN